MQHYCNYYSKRVTLGFSNLNQMREAMIGNSIKLIRINYKTTLVFHLPDAFRHL